MPERRYRRPLSDNPWLLWLVCPLVLLVSLVWYMAAFRLLSLPLLVAALAAWLTLSRHGQVRRLVLAWGAFLASTLLPFDISLHPTPRPYRFVPYVMGLPGEAGVEASMRGDIVSGGCVTDGLEPKWVFVWRPSGRSVPWNDISDRHLRELGLAMSEYLEDYDGVLPPLSSSTAAQQALASYIREDNIFADPRSGQSYPPNAALSQRRVKELPDLSLCVGFYEANPALDETRGFVTLDGQAHRIPESRWNLKR